MTPEIVNYFTSRGIRVMLSIGGITYTKDWNTALAKDAAGLGLAAAAVATRLGVGIEIDYEENRSPNLVGLQAFIDAYRSVHPYDASGTDPAARLTIDLAAGDRWLIGITQKATADWLRVDAPVLDFANAMVPSRQPSSSGAIANWQEHVDGKPQYAPPIPPLSPAMFTGSVYVAEGSRVRPECNNFATSLQKTTASFVQTRGVQGPGRHLGRHARLDVLGGREAVGPRRRHAAAQHLRGRRRRGSRDLRDPVPGAVTGGGSVAGAPASTSAFPARYGIRNVTWTVITTSVVPGRTGVSAAARSAEGAAPAMFSYQIGVETDSETFATPEIRTPSPPASVVGLGLRVRDGGLAGLGLGGGPVGHVEADALDRRGAGGDAVVEHVRELVQVADRHGDHVLELVAADLGGLVVGVVVDRAERHVGGRDVLVGDAELLDRCDHAGHRLRGGRPGGLGGVALDDHAEADRGEIRDDHDLARAGDRDRVLRGLVRGPVDGLVALRSDRPGEDGAGDEAHEQGARPDDHRHSGGREGG